MKRTLLITVLLCGTCLFGCQANSLESEIEDMKDGASAQTMDGRHWDVTKFDEVVNSFKHSGILSTYSIEHGIIVGKCECTEDEVERVYKEFQAILDITKLDGVKLYLEALDEDGDVWGYYDGEVLELK